MCLVDGSDPRYQIVLDKVSTTIDRNEVRKQNFNCLILISLQPDVVDLDILHSVNSVKINLIVKV